MKFRKHITVIFLAIFSCFMIACNPNKEESIVDNKQELSNQIESVSDVIESIAEENADNEVGNYVIPDESDFTWEEIEGGVALTRYTGTNKTIEVPSKLGNKDVIEIRGGAFPDGSVVGVKLPDSVAVIGEKAFYFCTSLIEIKFGSGTKIIGSKSFEGCVSLSNVILNQGLTDIDEMAFTTTNSLLSVCLPTSLERLGGGAFAMSGLKDLVIPGTVKSIEKQTFARCLSLEKVILEDGIESLADNAFQSCKAMKSIEIPDSVTEIGWDVFVNCEDLVIKASAGSAAETYAIEFGHTFEAN